MFRSVTQGAADLAQIPLLDAKDEPTPGASDAVTQFIAFIKLTLGEHGLKMPQLAHAVRVLVCGRSQTPSLDAVLALFERAAVLERLGEG